MISTVLLAAMVGGVAGAVLWYLKFHNPLPGVLIGAACGALLVFMFGRSPATVIAVGSQRQFEQDVLTADMPVVVDFYADRCPPCRKLAPTIKSLAKEYKGRVRFVKVDVDRGGKLAESYNIKSIPTIILFVKGEPVHTWKGAIPAEGFRPALDAVAAAASQ